MYAKNAKTLSVQHFLNHLNQVILTKFSDMFDT